MDFSERSSRSKNLFGSVNWGGSSTKSETIVEPQSFPIPLPCSDETYEREIHNLYDSNSNNFSFPHLGRFPPSNARRENTARTSAIPVFMSNSGTKSNISVAAESPSSAISLNDFHYIDMASACAFLGEELSVHGSQHSLSYSYDQQRVARAVSWDGISSQEALVLTPVLMKMPTNPSRKHLDQFLEKIPANAWMLPYVLACLPPADLQKALDGHALGDSSSVLGLNATKSLPQMPRFPGSPNTSWGKSMQTQSISGPGPGIGPMPTIPEYRPGLEINGPVQNSYFVGSLSGSGSLPGTSPGERMSLAVLSDRLSQSMSMSASDGLEKGGFGSHGGFYKNSFNGVGSSQHGMSYLSVDGDAHYNSDSLPIAPVSFLSVEVEDRSGIRSGNGIGNGMYHNHNHSHNSRDYEQGLDSSVRGCWRVLGTFLVSSDPSWVPWELRRLVLLDNYLFECPLDTASLLGFAQLNKAEVTSTLLEKLNRDNNKSQMSDGHSSFGRIDRDVSNGGPYSNNNQYAYGSNNGGHSRGYREDGASNGDRDAVQMFAVQISYLGESNINGVRKQAWIRSGGPRQTTELKELLLRASRLGVEDLYDFRSVPGEHCDLSSGRPTKVRVARRIPMSSCPSSPVDTGLDSSHLDWDASSSRMRGQGFGAPETGDAGDCHLGSGPCFLGSSGSCAFGEPYPHFALSSSPSSSSQRQYSQRGFHVVQQSVSPIARYMFVQPAAGDKYCALKTLCKQTYQQRVRDGCERADSIVREVLSQSLVCRIGLAQGRTPDNLPVVQVYGAFETVDGFSLELELMQSVDMCDKLQLHHRFSEEDTKSIVTQILDALTLCRTAGVGHRDVKLSNITLARPPPLLEGLPIAPTQDAPLKLKLADFGMAGFVGYDGCLRGRCGTIGYVAPEILSAGVHEGYSNNVDVFSLGVVAYTLLCGHEPFYGNTQAELKEANKRALFDWSHRAFRTVSLDAKDWICRALEPNHHARMTPTEALQHRWLCEGTDVYI